MTQPKITVVTTLYKSAAYIDEFFARSLRAVSPTAPAPQFIFVDDGSPDDSGAKVRALMREHPALDIRLVELSRNFGHHQAMRAGLARAEGELVFLIDCDLEEPPEIFREMLKRIETSGADGGCPDVVYAYQERRKGGPTERITGWIFYRLFNALADIEIPSNGATARLMRGGYVKAVAAFEETELFLDGIWAMAGFRQVGIPLKKSAKGMSAYSTLKKLSMSARALTSFSSKPLLLIFFSGIFFSFLSLAGIAFMLVQAFVFKASCDAAWPSAILAIALFGGLILAALGILGLYVASIFREVKRRPIVVKKTWTNALGKS